MLAIRMQRTGRKGHAQYRMIVQESRLTPTSGKIVISLGNYDPHSKVAVLNKEKAAYYLEHGAQPSGRVASLLNKEGVKLPKWVKLADKKAGKLKHPEKLRRNAPAEVKVKEETPAEPESAAEQEAASNSEASEESSTAAEEPAAEPAGETIAESDLKADESAEETAVDAPHDQSGPVEPKQ